MDSQGFVKLSTIAGFKRMRDLVKDQELIRIACSLSDSIDFVIGEDRVERLRLRDLWHKFVLPLNERSEPARNDGPKSFTYYQPPSVQMPPYSGPVMNPPYAAPSSAGIYPALPDEQMFQAGYGNGVLHDATTNGGGLNGHRYNPETQLSAVVPEYSPPLSPLTLESMTSFNDDQVEKLMVVLSFNEKGNSASPDFPGGTNNWSR